MYAALAGHAKCVRKLIQRHAVVSACDHSGRTAIHWAAYYGQYTTLKELVKAGTNIEARDYQHNTALHCAVYPEHTRALKTLLSRKVIVDCVDEEKMTPLMWAAYYGNFSALSLLAKAGANGYLQDIEGKTALHWTCGNKQPGPALLLMQNYENKLMGIADNFGRIPLHLACGEGNVAVVAAMLQCHTQFIMAKDELHRTPLLWAASCFLLILIWSR
jgi:ankyrin repeat protein